MTTNVGTMASISPPLERYRRAERTLWERFGLEPKEHVIDLVDPHVRLRVVEVGSGDPVIFIPGTGGTGPYWAPLVKQLSGFRCLLLDRPGWGMSEPIDYRGRPFGDLTAAILVGVMDHLGIDQADLVGASVGNIWALALAARQPTAVRRLVLVG